MKNIDRLTQLLDEEMEDDKYTWSCTTDIKEGISFFFIDVYVYEVFKTRLRFMVADEIIQILTDESWTTISRLDYSIKYFWISLLS